jgi:hypothetical protein
MRSTVLILTAVFLGAGSALAQGVKDPANYGTTTTYRQTTSSTQSSRPTAVQNIPSSALPSGKAVQQTYRNGKLVPYVR